MIGTLVKTVSDVTIPGNYTKSIYKEVYKGFVIKFITLGTKTCLNVYNLKVWQDDATYSSESKVFSLMIANIKENQHVLLVYMY